MCAPNEANVERMLSAMRAGDSGAATELLPVVYEELRALARQKLAQEPPGHTLQATALVHEAFVRLVGQQQHDWDGLGHFFAAAAEAMRRILIERARRYQTKKRGGGRRRVQLGDVATLDRDGADDLMSIDTALRKLETIDQRKNQVVKLRFFAGLTVEEIAAVLAISPATVKSDWAFAKAWLHREIAGADTP